MVSFTDMHRICVSFVPKLSPQKWGESVREQGCVYV